MTNATLEPNSVDQVELCNIEEKDSIQHFMPSKPISCLVLAIGLVVVLFNAAISTLSMPLGVTSTIFSVLVLLHKK